MTKRIEQNERIKRKYTQWLLNADGRDEATVDLALHAIRSYEESTGFLDFKRFHLDLPGQFKRHLKKAKNQRTGRPLSLATIDGSLRHVRKFHEWLAEQQGYKSRITRVDARYFNNNAKNARAAHAHRETQYPSLEQCAHAFRQMPERDVYERRDKAAFSLLMLTGARVSALGSLRLKHVNLHEGTIYQDAREVRTKNAKTFMSGFLPLESMYLTFFKRWIEELTGELMFGPTDPLFPKTEMGWKSDQGFAKIGLARACYSGSAFTRKILRSAFENAGLPYYNPHSIRKSLTLYGVEKYGHDPRKLKAWSLNLGHENIATTIGSYLPISEAEQVRIIKAMREDKEGED